MDWILRLCWINSITSALTSPRATDHYPSNQKTDWNVTNPHLIHVLQHIPASQETNLLQFHPNQNTRTKRNLFTEYVKVKLQAITFAKTTMDSITKTEISTWLPKPTKWYPAYLLAPEFEQKLLPDSNPMALQKAICAEFRSEQVEQSRLNTLLLLSQPDEDGYKQKLHQLLFEITSALGIPVLTWMPDAAGKMRSDQSHLVLRLEPVAWHISHALVDFLYEYGWNQVILVYNSEIPGSDALLKEMYERRIERRTARHPKYFEFEVQSIFNIRGQTGSTQKSSTNIVTRSWFENILSQLQNIWQSNVRVIIFNGGRQDVDILLQVADSLQETEYSHLNQLFHGDFVWILTPTSMSSCISLNGQFNGLTPHRTQFGKIGGLFGFAYPDTRTERQKMIRIAQIIWHRAMTELTFHLTGLYPPEVPIQLDSPTTTSVAYFHQILSKLRPPDLCQDDRNIPWQWGRRLHNIMRATELEFDGEAIRFLPNGGLNVSSLQLYNSKVTDGKMFWQRVGLWTMQNKWRQNKSHLQVDGIAWPAKSNHPPALKSNRAKLRVVTMMEEPFVVYQIKPTGGSCKAYSVECTVSHKSFLRLKSMTREARSQSITTTSSGSDTLSKLLLTKMKVGTRKVCCSGMMMELLIEIAGDLDIDFELFEQPDLVWGAWTPSGWKGMIQTLVEEKADMAVSSLKITANRSKDIEFGFPILETGIGIAVAAQDLSSPMLLLEAFDYKTWLAIVLINVPASAACLVFFEWFNDIGDRKLKGRNLSLFNRMWLLWSMLFGSTISVDYPRWHASRFFTTSWALFSLLFFATYTANLTVLFLTEQYYHDPSGLNDSKFQQNSETGESFRFSTVSFGATEEALRMNYPEILSGLVPYNDTGVEGGLESVKSGNLDAFIYDKTVLDYWVNNDVDCRLRRVGSFHAKTGYSFGFPKGSPWVQKVNERILEYQRSGKMKRLEELWLSGPCQRSKLNRWTVKRLGLRDFIGVFALFGVGYLLCLVTIPLEGVLARNKRHKEISFSMNSVTAKSIHQCEEGQQRHVKNACGTREDQIKKYETQADEEQHSDDPLKVLTKTIQGRIIRVNQVGHTSQQKDHCDYWDMNHKVAVTPLLTGGRAYHSNRASPVNTPFDLTFHKSPSFPTPQKKKRKQTKLVVKKHGQETCIGSEQGQVARASSKVWIQTEDLIKNQGPLQHHSERLDERQTIRNAGRYFISDGTSHRKRKAMEM